MIPRDPTWFSPCWNADEAGFQCQWRRLVRAVTEVRTGWLRRTIFTLNFLCLGCLLSTCPPCRCNSLYQLILPRNALINPSSYMPSSWFLLVELFTSKLTTTHHFFNQIFRSFTISEIWINLVQSLICYVPFKIWCLQY